MTSQSTDRLLVRVFRASLVTANDILGGRNILGLPKALVVLHRYGKGVEIGPSNYRKVCAYLHTSRDTNKFCKTSSLTDSSSRALLAKLPSRRITPLVNDGKYQEQDGFIRLPTRRGRQAAEDSYRSIPITKDNDESNSSALSDSEPDSSEDESDQPVLTAHQETLKRLDQELTAHPDSIPTWMALLQQTLSNIPIISKNATKARCEIASSILSRAISAAPQNAANKGLRLAYLRAGEEIWHESKLRSEWRDALKLGGIEIEMDWLEWQIRKAENGIDGVIESAVRAIERLGLDDDVAKVRIFWRVAVTIRDAGELLSPFTLALIRFSSGYSERAFGMFQAQAEL